jgi:hypothetical protein
MPGRCVALVPAFLAASSADATNLSAPPSILNNTTHEVYHDATDFAALGIDCSTSATCSTSQPPSRTVLAINQTGSGSNLDFVNPATLVSYATRLSVPQYGVGGTTPLLPQVPYQILGQSSSWDADLIETVDQPLYATLQPSGVVYSWAFCPATASAYPPLALVTVLPNNAHAMPSAGGCGYAQGVEFSIPVNWTPISATYGSMAVKDPSSSQNAMQVVLAALKMRNPGWTWFDIKAALRQTASNWSTGYAPYNSSTGGYGYGDISWGGALTISRTSALYLQPPGMRIQNHVSYATITLYPFRQTRRGYEVLYSVDPSYNWPRGCGGHGMNGCEYTAVDLGKAGIKVSNPMYSSQPVAGLITPMYFYVPAVKGVVTFIAFTTDGGGNYSRVESFSEQSVTLSAEE